MPVPVVRYRRGTKITKVDGYRDAKGNGYRDAKEELDMKAHGHKGTGRGYLWGIQQGTTIHRYMDTWIHGYMDTWIHGYTSTQNGWGYRGYIFYWQRAV